LADSPVPAVFLDRDGVINRRRPDHVKSWAEFEFLPGALRALADLRAMNAPVVIITNQGAVGRGLISADQLRDIHIRMLRAIEAAGGHVSAIYACLHAPADGCACRKPKPALVHQAAHDLHLDLPRSVMIGDSPTDLEAGRAAGCRPILVNDSRDPVDADVLKVDDLVEAAILWRTLSVPAGVVQC
jgi:histidinol-phosphate phosphatase family protein